MALTQSGSTRDHWSSRSAFLLAAIGSAVGLGNLWRFPAEAGSNGGGAFVLFYILCVVLIGLPVLLAETLIGRHGQASAPESVRRVASASRASSHWSVLASMGVFAAFLILSFYCVVGGWVLYYVGVFAVDLVNSGVAGGAFAGQSADHIESLFPALIGSAGWTVGLDALFLGITLYFVARGVSGGIEVVANWMMPAFFVLLLAITVYGMFGGGFGQAIDYLFTFEPEKLTGPVMLAAVSQAFFSLSLGVAGMITYGSYVGRNVNLAGTSAMIAGADTLVGLLAGLCVFPIVFSAGLPEGAGPGLMFVTLPHAFQDMPFGSVVGLLFFIMVFFAALTSSVGLLEVPTAWLIDRFRIVRRFSAMIVAFGAMVLGALAALSFNALSGWHPLGFIPLFEGQGFFDVLDGLTAKLFMPLGAILTALFVGWVADRKLVDIENGIGGALHLTWLFLVRFVCPLALVGILVMGLFPDLFG
ncbi:MAG: sodium-dependent transporter [Erythrobacter sp.]|nr:sodium-dependent transporter [Erythrobacter sp.]